jgi:glycosyltransferase involved in cell wall biosynthesis
MGASNLSVSVAMATYNGQRFIQRQLDSLAAQKKLPAELVVTDDGSGDDTVAIVEVFAKTAPFPIRIYRNPTRLGYRANFMHAASLCRSDLIAFCDQDDSWYPQKLEASVRSFSESDVLFVYHNADVVSENVRIGSLTSRAAKQSVLTPLSSNPWWHPLGFTQVFRRSLLRLSHLWPNSLDEHDLSQPLAHDQWFYFLAGAFGKIVYLDDALVAYTQHGGNTAFGWQKPKYSESIKHFFRNRSDDYGRCALAAERRAAILENATDKLEGVWAERARLASEYYQTMSWLYGKRQSLYTSTSFIDRFYIFLSIIRRGGYAGIWGFGRKSIVPDLCLGVPVGHLLRPSTGHF